MKTLLLTGATGFVAQHFSQAYADQYRIINLSRRIGDSPGEWIRGDFSAFEDLRQLDLFDIDAAIHLAAVTGGCLERDGILVNVEGTRCLLSYLADRGCRRCVLASSIAVVGIEDEAYKPLKLPITEDEPCLDRHGYGLSKYLMEELGHYMARQRPDLCICSLRLGALKPNAEAINDIPLREAGGWWFAGLGQLAVADAIEALRLGIEQELPAGSHVYQIGPPRCPSTTPVVDLIEHSFGPDAFDLAAYRYEGQRFAPIYSIEKAQRELGYAPSHIPPWMDDH